LGSFLGSEIGTFDSYCYVSNGFMNQGGSDIPGIIPSRLFFKGEAADSSYASKEECGLVSA